MMFNQRLTSQPRIRTNDRGDIEAHVVSNTSLRRLMERLSYLYDGECLVEPVSGDHLEGGWRRNGFILTFDADTGITIDDVQELLKDL